MAAESVGPTKNQKPLPLNVLPERNAVRVTEEGGKKERGRKEKGGRSCKSIALYLVTLT